MACDVRHLGSAAEARCAVKMAAWRLLIIGVCGVLPLLGAALPERRTCANVKNGIGHTSPAGDIYLEHGVDALDLDCIITNPKILRDPTASESLRFVHGTSLINGSTITDAARIHLHIDADQLKIDKPTYSCMWENELVCDNVVFVGTKPQPSDFRCISYNNDNLTCSWRHPFNSIETKYAVNYTARSTPKLVTHCPEVKYDVRDDRYRCVWTLTTRPPYRQSAEYFNIVFSAMNRLGACRHEVANFHHFAHIIPNPPERLEVVSATTSSLLLKWGVPPTIQHRPLQYRVMYTCGLEMPERVRDRAFKLAVVNFFTEVASCTFNLTGLPYAHDLCDVRVALRVNWTRDDEMWSHNATLYARTAATIPGEGPTVDAGSFKHINDTAVRIYWHQVPAEYENGRNLRYNVTLVRAGGTGSVVIDRTRPMKNSVVIGNLSSNQNYTFAVYASNDVGPQATPHAQITIPAQYQRPYQVRELKKIENTNGFKLRWSPRQRGHVLIANYTVFWCREITKSFNEDCNGDWDWASVPYDQEEYRYVDASATINSTSFRVAIASNSAFGSSGMFFPTCEESGEQIPTINLIKPTQFSDTSVKLSWMVKCTTEGIANYTIEYCIADQTSYDCRNKTKLKEEVDGSVTEFNVGGLTPYATYLFTIYPTMKNGNKGKTSDPERVTTLEGKPTEPSGLLATAVTNSSIALQWKEPTSSNGFITYEIFYNGVKVATNLNETSYVLSNLRSYGLYNITVVACTSNKCSDRSNAISLRTLMGTPGRVGQPTAMSINTSDILIVWTQPAEARGPVSYEIRVDDGGEFKTYANKSTKFHYKCDSKTKTFGIIVRALNHDDELNRTYVGEWSDEFSGSCAPGVSWLIPVLLVLGVALIGAAIFGRKLYSRCKKMQDIGVTLPKTLQQSSEPSAKDASQRDVKLPPPVAADEELLLQSRPETATKSSSLSSAASSGCSSAQGSVTSESDGTFSAASDSGTEQSELRKRSFRNSSKTSLLASADVTTAKGESIEAEMDDVATYVDVEPIVRPADVQTSSYVTVAQARSVSMKPKEEIVSRPYVQVSDLKAAAAATQKREPIVDSSRSYVTVGQMPPASKLSKLYDAKLLKED